MVRNQFLKLISKEKFDFLLSIDSDILVKPDILNKLLDDKKDIVSALVYNGHEYGKDWFNYRIHTVKNGREGYFIYEYMPKNIFEVDVTGACYLIARKVIDSKVKYKPTTFGEDIGFCEEAKKKGFKIYCNPTIGTYHKLVGDNR
jgi:GT2 family glycosyltransferase